MLKTSTRKIILLLGLKPISVFYNFFQLDLSLNLYFSFKDLRDRKAKINYALDEVNKGKIDMIVIIIYTKMEKSTQFGWSCSCFVK